MIAVRHRLQIRKRALASLDELWRQPNVVELIHYSCESFYDRKDGSSPRITSVAVRNLGTGQTVSFSIHLVAERRAYDLNAIQQHYNELERTMLDEFFQFVRYKAASKWLHWNMRDVNFGFAAIEHRYRVLGGEPAQIPDVNRVDLAWILVDVYGPNYVGNPRLTKLVEFNSISSKDFLSGAEEAAAFETRSYVKLHQSTLRKVEILATIATRAWDGTLLTNASRRDMYGTTIGGWIESITDHWLYKLLGFIGIVASIVGLATLAR